MAAIETLPGGVHGEHIGTTAARPDAGAHRSGAGSAGGRRGDQGRTDSHHRAADKENQTECRSLHRQTSSVEPSGITDGCPREASRGECPRRREVRPLTRQAQPALTRRAQLAQTNGSEPKGPGPIQHRALRGYGRFLGPDLPESARRSRGPGRR